MFISDIKEKKKEEEETEEAKFCYLHTLLNWVFGFGKQMIPPESLIQSRPKSYG